MNIAKFSVSRPVTVTMRIAAMVLLGAICLTRLPVDLLPEVSLPSISVVTSWPNVAPEEIEAQITRPIERAVSTLSNVYEVSSTSSEGNSSVRIQFNWGTDIGQAAVDVLQQVQRAQRSFPNDPTLQNPTVYKFDPSQMPILTIAVTGIADQVKLRTLLDNEISPIIEAADGVASVAVTGGQERVILVEVDPARLRAHNLTLSQITSRLVQENANLPAGIARQSDTEYLIRSLGWFTDPKEIERLPVGSFNGRLVTLRDVATVSDTHAETRMYSRLNGEPAAGLIVSKQSGANTVNTAKAVFKRVERARELYPELSFHVASDQSHFIEHAVADVKTHAIIGGILAVLILLFFLRNVRSTLVVALSIPVSVISTFALLYLCGYTLNTMSLGGLALAVGLIVDDAVVVLENIFRHIERDGKSAEEAAVTGTQEILSAVVASTLTVIIVFLPLLLIKGQAGQMFAQFALVVVFAISLSLVDATMSVPMFASRLIRGEAHRENLSNGHRPGLLERAFAAAGRFFDSLDTTYRGALYWALRHRFWVIAIAGAVTAATWLLTPFIGTEMMPETDTGDLTVRINMPVGTALDKTDAVVRKAEEIIMRHPDVEMILASAGTGMALRGTSPRLQGNEGSVTVKLRADRKRSSAEVIGELRKELSQISGARIQIRSTDLVSRIITGGAQNIQINIFGNDLATLSRLARTMMDRMREIPGLENLDVNWQEATPEVQWRVDRDKALQLGVSFTDVANTLKTATSGTIASYFQEDGFQYPILVQLPESKRKNVDDLMNIPLALAGSGGASGEGAQHVLLGQVAQPEFAVGPSDITRLNRRRYISVSGSPQGRPLSEIRADVEKALADVQMPAGYYRDWGTSMKRQQEEFAGMGLAVILAVLLIYMLLAAQFESFVHPLTILASVPLSAIGVALALFLTGRSFGLTAFIGLLMLVGIVVKNGILLIDYTNILRHRGMDRDTAVLTAGPTRLRPILMTSSASILGMLPIATGLGQGMEMQAPMATAVIGGLTTSTFLTLLVVPVVYTLFDDLANLGGRGKRRRAKAASHAEGNGHAQAEATVVTARPDAAS